MQLRVLPRMVLLGLILYTSALTCVAGIKVLRGNENEGQLCEISEGVFGRCIKNSMCRNNDGTVEWNGFIKLCAPGPSQEVFVCCRKPFEAANKLCHSWKRYWRRNNGKCVTKHNLIVGGEEAKPGQFPEIVHVGKFERHKQIRWICGGTLLSPHFVLTAAHCIIRKGNYVMRFGQHDTLLPNLKNISRIVGPLPIGLFREEDVHGETRMRAPVEQTIKVRRVIPHPEYENPYNDIALLQLERPVVFTRRVLPACLPSNSNEDFSNQPLTMAGWGALGWNKRGMLADILQKVQLPIINQKECARYLYEKSFWSIPQGILTKQLCAGEAGKSSCKGDSGGPLVIQMREARSSIPCEHTLAGVVSFGHGCGRLSVYTRVSSYVDWITGHLAPKLIPQHN